jgi:hypothetical protein
MHKHATAPLIVLDYWTLDGQRQRAVFGWTTIVYILITAAFIFITTAPSSLVFIAQGTQLYAAFLHSRSSLSFSLKLALPFFAHDFKSHHLLSFLT